MTEQVISDLKKIDSYFLDNQWRYKDRESLLKLAEKINDILASTISLHLGLSKKDVSHLVAEKSNYCNCIFLDTVFRLNQKGAINHDKIKKPENFHKTFSSFFNQELVQGNLGTSRAIRCKLANKILEGLSLPRQFEVPIKDPESITIKDTNISIYKNQSYWILRNKYLEKAPFIIIQYMKVTFNFSLQALKGNLTRLGHLNIDKKFMAQLPGIRWVPIKINLDKFNGSISFQFRDDLHKKLKLEFSQNVKKLPEWNFLFNEKTPPDEFFDVLLGLNLSQMEPILFSKDQLNACLHYSRTELKKAKISSLFSLGYLYTFESAILSAASRTLGIPVLDYQTGGRPMYKTEKATVTHADFSLNWADLIKEKETFKILKVPNPPFSTGPKYKKKNRPSKKHEKRVLYTGIALSNLFSLEHSLSPMPMDIKKHREWINDLFIHSEDILTESNSTLYIKIKGFDYTLLKNYQYLMIPKVSLNQKKVPVRYLTLGNTVQYFSKMDVHLFCGLSTTFSESMNFNIPSICLWNLGSYQPRPEYETLFKDLIASKIIATTTESFKEILKSRLTSDDWWSEKTQNARKNFCELMAYSSSNWVELNNKTILKAALFQEGQNELL